MRRIIHIDMDCFYAAVEQKLNPELKGKPIAVGGQPGRRSVLSTASYEARAFGVRSAMTSSTAVKLCPELILVSGNYEQYKIESQAIREIFYEYTDMVQPLSLDEAYLDVTEYVEKNNITASKLAKEIRDKIYEKTELTASAGIAPNKLLAKIASDIKKPNGQCTVTPDLIESFMKELPVNKIWGVGKVTAAKMSEMGIETCAQLQAYSFSNMVHYFGKFGSELYHFCRGEDEREVKNDGVRKSLSVERTFLEDISELGKIVESLDKVFDEFVLRAEKYEVDTYKSMFIKMKYADFTQTTVEKPFSEIEKSEFIELIQRAWEKRESPIRLLGIGVKFKSVTKGAKDQLTFSF